MSSWYERSGGYLVAIFLHILLISWLAIHIQLQAEMVTSKGVQIELSSGEEFQASAEETMTVEAPPSPPPSEDIARTGDEEDAAPEAAEELLAMMMEKQPPPPEQNEPEPTPEPDVTVEPAKETEPEPEATPDVEAVPEPAPEPTPRELTAEEREANKKSEEQARLLAAWEKYNKAAPTNSSRNAIKNAIEKEEVKVRGSQYLDKLTAGADTGAVRNFKLLGNQAIVNEIMKRYDMRYVTRYVRKGQKYLNQVETNQGAFVSSDVEGYAEVMEIGPEGNRKLKMLEIEALRASGFDPKTARLLVIEFGLVQTEHGWDLGVTDLKAEKIE